ncbi:hypothetical protein ACRJ4B_43410 [Streptomyces sp. GTA36]
MNGSSTKQHLGQVRGVEDHRRDDQGAAREQQRQPGRGTAVPRGFQGEERPDHGDEADRPPHRRAWAVAQSGRRVVQTAHEHGAVQQRWHPPHGPVRRHHEHSLARPHPLPSG